MTGAEANFCGLGFSRHDNFGKQDEEVIGSWWGLVIMKALERDDRGGTAERGYCRKGVQQRGGTAERGYHRKGVPQKEGTAERGTAERGYSRLSLVSLHPSF